MRTRFKLPKHSLFLLVALFACVPAAPKTSVADDPAVPLIDGWTTALGGRARLTANTTVYIAGRSTFGGLSGHFAVWQTARGERRYEIDIGGVERAVRIYDGVRGWYIDRNDQVRALDGPELEIQRALAYLGANAALLPGRLAGRVLRDGEGLRLEPAGGRPLTVRFDPATRLPLTIAHREYEKTHVTTLSDWREVQGIRFPFVVRDEDVNPLDTLLMTVETVELDRPIEAARFAQPAQRAPDYRFDAGHDVATPIELVRSLIFVPVAVNGSAPLAFMIDTGASETVISESRLERLGLRAVGKVATGGFGPDAVMSYVKGVSFQLAGVRVENQTVTTLAQDAIAGHAIDGTLGYDFLSRFVVEFDYARRTIKLHDPGTFHYQGKGVEVALTLESSVPNIEATVVLPGRPRLSGHFIVDTGCICEMSFNTPFVDDHRLIEALPKVVRPPRSSGAGAGGESEALIGRIGALQINSLTIKSPIAHFSRDRTGSDMDPDSAGVLGGTVWQRFVITLDYRGRRMWLEKNETFDKPSTWVGTGILWARRGDGANGDLVVRGLIEGAPGAEAGLAVGDILISIDDRAAGDLTQKSIADLLGEVGKPRRVVMRRAGHELTFTLTPRDLL